MKGMKTMNSRVLAIAEIYNHLTGAFPTELVHTFLQEFSTQVTRELEGGAYDYGTEDFGLLLGALEDQMTAWMDPGEASPDPLEWGDGFKASFARNYNAYLTTPANRVALGGFTLRDAQTLVKLAATPEDHGVVTLSPISEDSTVFALAVRISEAFVSDTED